MNEEDANALKKITGATTADNRELSKVLESMLTRGNKADRLVAEGAAVEMRRDSPPNVIARKMLDGSIESPRRYNKRVRVHGESVDVPNLDGIIIDSSGKPGDFYMRRVGPNAGKVYRERGGPSDMSITIDQEKSGLMPDFAFYQFQAMERLLNARKRGAAQQSIRHSDVYEVYANRFIPKENIEQMKMRVAMLERAQQMSLNEAMDFMRNIANENVMYNEETQEVRLPFEMQVKLQEANRILGQEATKQGMTVNQFLNRGTGPRPGRTYMREEDAWERWNSSGQRDDDMAGMTDPESERSSDILDRYLYDDSPDMLSKEEMDVLISRNGYYEMNDSEKADAILSIVADRNKSAIVKRRKSGVEMMIERKEKEIERKRYEYATDWAIRFMEDWDKEMKKAIEENPDFSARESGLSQDGDYSEIGSVKGYEWVPETGTLEIFFEDSRGKELPTEKIPFEKLFDAPEEALQWEVQAVIGRKVPKKMRYTDNNMEYTLTGIDQDKVFNQTLEYSLTDPSIKTLDDMRMEPDTMIEVEPRDLLNQEGDTFDKFYYRKLPIVPSGTNCNNCPSNECRNCPNKYIPFLPKPLPPATSQIFNRKINDYTWNAAARRLDTMSLPPTYVRTVNTSKGKRTFVNYGTAWSSKEEAIRAANTLRQKDINGQKRYGGERSVYVRTIPTKFKNVTVYRNFVAWRRGEQK